MEAAQLLLTKAPHKNTRMRFIARKRKVDICRLREREEPKLTRGEIDEEFCSFPYSSSLLQQTAPTYFYFYCLLQFHWLSPSRPSPAAASSLQQMNAEEFHALLPWPSHPKKQCSQEKRCWLWSWVELGDLAPSCGSTPF